VAAAVILPEKISLMGLKDSKQLSPSKREKLFNLIQQRASAWSIGIVRHDMIDRMNILRASLLAMEKAVSRLAIIPDYILIDGTFPIGNSIPQLSLKHGDALCACIAAASIVAKVIRDRIMRAVDQLYPEYAFGKNKGYPTQEHLSALKVYGPCPWHRKTFRGVKELLYNLKPRLI
jgi:ribonuclease HII